MRRVRCVWCFADYIPSLEVDHIIPKSRGGKNTADNVQLLCSACNRAKGALTPDEFVALLDESDAARLPGLRRFCATTIDDGSVTWADAQDDDAILSGFRERYDGALRAMAAHPIGDTQEARE